MPYKNGVWAKTIANLQTDDGSWGQFHSMAIPRAHAPITTEQALRRLKILGFSIEDEVVYRAVQYMHDCLLRKQKVSNADAISDTYNDMMYAAWIRQFTDDDEYANNIACQWSQVISKACMEYGFDEALYYAAYDDQFGKIKRESLSISFNKFYPVAIVANLLEAEKERIFFEKILSNPTGIYYLGYDRALNTPPVAFASKDASRFLGAIEVLSQYSSNQCRQKLGFVVDWLNENKAEDGTWDMGSSVKDNLYFPLSDSWKKVQDRKIDCSYRITNIVNALIG